MISKNNILLASLLSITLLFVSNIGVYAEQTNNESKNISIVENHITSSTNNKISEEKMNEYRETYKLMYGSEDGFDENVIQENADYILSFGESNPLETEMVSLRKQIVPKYFNWIKWVTRSNGVISLSISPTRQFLDIKNTNVYAAASSESWGIVYRNWSGSSKWKNTKAMQQQYLCHTLYAKFKVPWNLEPHRTETNFAKVVSGKCNP